MIFALQFARKTFDRDCTLSARPESNDFLEMRVARSRLLSHRLLVSRLQLSRQRFDRAGEAPEVRL
jgi:hypothetical protein